MENQCWMSSISPMMPPSVMAVHWWMLWIPKVYTAAPSAMNNTFTAIFTAYSLLFVFIFSRFSF